MGCYLCDLLKKEDDYTLIQKFNCGSVHLIENQFFFGRIMYVLNEHWADISEVPYSVYEVSCRDMRMFALAVKKALKADLMNVASLGNYAQHVHWHIIPRYTSDLCWGKPPWPHGEKFLPENEFHVLKKRIYNAINA